MSGNDPFLDGAWGEPPPASAASHASPVPALRSRWRWGGWRSPLARSGGLAHILPKGGLLGPMPSVVAIMVTLTVIAAAGGLGLHNAAATASSQLSGGITVQFLEPRPEARAAQTAASVALLSVMPGVSGVRPVPQAELDALIAPWLGNPGDEIDAVPVPALVDARLTGAVTPARLAAITRALAPQAPAARVDAQASWLGPVFAAISSLQWLAVALVGLLAAATVASVLLAARTALGDHRETIGVVHMLGGTDAQIARIFRRAVGVDAALGAAAGTALALVAIWLLGTRFAALGAGGGGWGGGGGVGGGGGWVRARCAGPIGACWRWCRWGRWCWPWRQRKDQCAPRCAGCCDVAPGDRSGGAGVGAGLSGLRHIPAHARRHCPHGRGGGADRG